MYHCKKPVGQVQLLRQRQAPEVAQPKRLRHCAGLHISAGNTSALSTLTGVDALLQDGPYIPANEGSSTSTCKLVQAYTALQVFVLWPALQAPPAWLVQDYDTGRGAEVRVSAYCNMLWNAHAACEAAVSAEACWCRTGSCATSRM